MLSVHVEPVDVDSVITKGDILVDVVATEVDATLEQVVVDAVIVNG